MSKKLLNILLVISMFFMIPTIVFAEDDIILYAPIEEPEVVEEETTTKYKSFIIDDADLFSDEQESKILEQMQDLLQYGHIGVITLSENSSSTESYASNYYHSNLGVESGTIIVIDMDNRNVYIFSDGENYKTITSGKAYIITDNIYQYATYEDYYKCVSVALNQIQSLLEGKKIAEPMRHISNFVLALTTAFFINFYIVRKVSKIKQATDKEILKNCDIKFGVGEISAIKVGEHRVYNPPSSSSGGSSGGGGGGGGSSGGGGGHSF